MVKIEINGIPVEAREGSMVIEAADHAGIAIPRFCYHKKLSIAANCRMCLVEVEKAPKPLPACATPVTEGMKVFTDSPKAIAAQKGVMEFLLINHPLDCPICDQGGECELQDLAMGYGSDVSRYTESKRVVKDKNIGPLIATDLTRCIHCTRCVRFGAEVAGIREMGATGRGEHTTIGTYIERSVDSELSGNVIDLCPVGALTSKPFRFQARAWEMIQHDGVAPHDGIGSNIYLHSRRGKLMRVVPRENESINECWISDRDRFSYQGINSEDRLTAPLLKEGGEWREASWEEALEAAAEALSSVKREHGADELGFLVHPTATLEELYLFQKLARSLGSNHIDHRLREVDFRDDDTMVQPSFGAPMAQLETMDSVLVVGSNLRKEQPLLAHRVRKAALAGAQVSVADSIAFDFSFPVANRCISSPDGLASELTAIALAAAELASRDLPSGIEEAANNPAIAERHRNIAKSLQESGNSVVLVGNLANQHGDAATLRALAAFIASATDSGLGILPAAGNSAGAWLAGALPHRGVGGAPVDNPGVNAALMTKEGLKGYLLLGAEPDRDFADPAATVAALAEAERVVALTAFRSAALERVSDVLLPIAAFAETSGTYVNGQGDWQSFSGAVPPPGEARPAWKVLRVLGNLLQAEDFEYNSSDEVLQELRDKQGSASAGSTVGTVPPRRPAEGTLLRIGETPIYAVDPIVRRASALQQTRDADCAVIRIAPQLAERLGLADGDNATATQAGKQVTLPVVVDERVADGAVWLAAGIEATAELGPAMGPIELARG
ncbi:MAG: NADH-quinone oxidoreductase subunit NuoG [Gammaproteobacteria bacterium]